MTILSKRAAPAFGDAAGFTLVELMIVLVLSWIIAALIFAAYTMQQRVYVAQTQVAIAQQNLRAAADPLIREIRMAGYDPTGRADAAITTMSPGQFSFSFDRNEDGDTSDPGEIIDFGFSAAAGNDADRDGIPDSATAGVPNPLPLGRQTGGAGGYQAIAENFQAVEFHYLDANGNTTADPEEVRTVQVSLLAVANEPDLHFHNNLVYCPASNPENPATGQCTNPALAVWGPYNDDYRRRLLITTMEIRNLGI